MAKGQQDTLDTRLERCEIGRRKMAHEITNEDTGRIFTFESEAAWEEAMDWYNATPKAEIIKFCEANGLSLDEQTTDPYYKSGVKLISDWPDAAMALFAKRRQIDPAYDMSGIM